MFGGVALMAVNLMAGGVLAVAGPAIFAMFARGKIHEEFKKRANELAPEVMRETAKKVAPKLDEMIEEFAQKLDTWVVSAGEELHREVVEVLRAAKDAREAGQQDEREGRGRGRGPGRGAREGDRAHREAPRRALGPTGSPPHRRGPVVAPAESPEGMTARTPKTPGDLEVGATSTFPSCFGESWRRNAATLSRRSLSPLHLSLTLASLASWRFSFSAEVRCGHRPWHFLNFLPLPQWQASLRPGRSPRRRVWGTPTSLRRISTRLEPIDSRSGGPIA